MYRFVLEGEIGLLELLAHRPVGARAVEVLDELHRDRAAALGRGAGLEVVHHRAHQAVVVDAVVFVEALVLDRDGGVLQDLGDRPARDDGGW